MTSQSLTPFGGRSPRRGGFTLVELLTVIAIITLLVSVLIPAVQAIRNQGKDTATATQLKALGNGAELYRNDFNRYPDSRGFNPFEGDVELMGAQWLALQLIGPDSRGYVKPEVQNDTDGDRQITAADWDDWYSLNPTRDVSRFGPYVEVKPEWTQTVERLIQEDAEVDLIPSGLVPGFLGGDGGDTNWNNGRLPFFVDAFGYPVLYYRANPGTEDPYTTGTPGGSFNVGRYDQSDNAFFTGSDGAHGRFPISAPGFDLGGIAEDPANFRHPIGILGYVEDQTQRPDLETFARFTYNEDIFEQSRQGTNDGRIWPRNPDSFLLISAGRDGLYGTADDITNFAQ